MLNFQRKALFAQSHQLFHDEITPVMIKKDDILIEYDEKLRINIK